PLTHSVSLLNAPLWSTQTTTGALPTCLWAKSSSIFCAPALGQSAGWPNSAPIIITTGSAGGGLVAYHEGGRDTNSSRCLNPDASLGIVTDRIVPLMGLSPLRCISRKVAASI